MHVEWPVNVLRASNSDELEVVLTSPRSIVYLTVDWSVPERKSRQTFIEFARQFGDTRRTLIAVVGEDNVDIRGRLRRSFATLKRLAVQEASFGLKTAK
jgi:hypothetical protein